MKEHEEMKALVLSAKNAICGALNDNEGIIIGVNNETAREKPKNGNMFTLEQLQRAVEGYVELVRVKVGGKEAYMFCNEDGYAMQKEPNLLASLLYGQQIVGNVIITNTNQID